MALAKPGESKTYTEEAGFVVQEVQSTTGVGRDTEVEEEFPEDFEDYYPMGMLEELNKDRTFQIQSKREDTRGRLAMVYTVATFLVFGLGFIVAVIDGVLTQTSIVDKLTTLIPLISGVFLGTLGFVLGYYFRRAEDDNSQS